MYWEPKLTPKYKPVTSSDGQLRNSHLFLFWQKQVYPQLNEDPASEAKSFICTESIVTGGALVSTLSLIILYPFSLKGFPQTA